MVQIPLEGLGASCFTAFKCRLVVTSIVSKLIGNGAGPLAVNGRLHVWYEIISLSSVSFMTERCSRTTRTPIDGIVRNIYLDDDTKVWR